MHNNYSKDAEHKKNIVCHASYSIYKSERVKLKIKEKLSKLKTEYTNKNTSFQPQTAKACKGPEKKNPIQLSLLGHPKLSEPWIPEQNTQPRLETSHGQATNWYGGLY